MKVKDDYYQQTNSYLLVAMPKLEDPYFSQTVTLIVQHDKEGVIGVILNRPLPLKLSDTLNTAEYSQLLKGQKIYFGGPVELDRGWFIHGYPDLDPEGLMITKDLYFSSDPEVMEEIIKQHGSQRQFIFRFFIGYSGWDAGQLEKEMASSSWLTAPFSRDDIFSTLATKLWKKTISNIGAEIVNLSSNTSEAIVH